MLLAAALGAALGACPGPDAPGPAEVDLPGSVVAMGDSITTAAVPSAGHVQARNPELSWATGTELDSHYARLLEERPEVRRRNVATPGARMADAAGQAREAVSTGADYVTFLFGGNDVCAGTPVEEFEAAYARALETVLHGLPDAEVLVVSVPDVVGLWDLFGDDPRARAIWERTGTCPGVLSGGSGPDSRQEARDRWGRYNEVLARLCDGHDRCVHDGGAVGEHLLERQEVSEVDRFHPSVEGQRRLAAITWEAWTQRRRP